MFTDGPVTPVRLEILVDLLRICRQGAERDDIYRLLQPTPLSGSGSKYEPAKATIRAGIDLGLVEEEKSKLSLAITCRKEKDAKSAILTALDERVLGSTDVEDYFALFYAYYLGLGKGVYERATDDNETWANKFNKVVFEEVPQTNRFNGTKLTGLHRWFHYAGLGWYDPAGNFNANPFERVQRSLPEIFGRQKSIEADVFTSKLSALCPELDGGNIFKIANPKWKTEQRKYSLGVSHALIELHLDEVIRLCCPADSAGWSIEDAEPPGGDDFKSWKVSSVELIGKA
jgi:hypothetical protein